MQDHTQSERPVLRPATERRILHFLNTAREAAALSDAIRDRREGKSTGTGLGLTVAQRLLDARQTQRGRGFSSLEEVREVPGMGEDKILDLIKSFDKPAAQAFHHAMYDGVILKNWELEYFTTPFDDEEAFQAVIGSRSTLTDFVARQVVQISHEKYSNSKAAELAGELLKKCYDEHFPDPHYGAYALAFWFYQFDADNWFTFERVRTETEHYLSYYPHWDDRLELHLYKGFDNTGVLVSAVTQDDLPVVINRGERAITIWTSQLND